MPAPSSSRIVPAIGHLAERMGDATEDSPGLLAVLAGVADPRHRRGVRHRLAAIVGLAVCAVLGGARSFTAIAALDTACTTHPPDSPPNQARGPRPTPEELTSSTA